ncbi:hypothetical protein FQZ97_997330 [compost metagenome]
MHGADARAHGQRATEELPERLFGLAHQPQGESRDEHGDQQRQQGQWQVVAQGDGQAEGEHADEVHRPDADAHGDGTTADPQHRAKSLAAGHPPGQVQRRVGREDGHQQGNENEGVVVAAREHEEPLHANAARDGGKTGRILNNFQARECHRMADRRQCRRDGCRGEFIRQGRQSRPREPAGRTCGPVGE